MKRAFTRRRFLRWSSLAALGAFAPGARPSAAWPRNMLYREEDYPAARLPLNLAAPPETAFALGIASGDPAPTGVVLWTRVNESVWHPDRRLWFQVASDEAFTQVVTQGQVGSAVVGPASDYTASVDLIGRLSPGQRYYYRFIYSQVVSQVGRCRTLPHPNSIPTAIQIGVVNCQAFSGGYYGAFHHLAQQDVDYVLHLGDFIYEYDRTDGPYADRTIALPSGAPVAVNLNDYRYLYRRFRSDPFLREALARHTFIFTWDDHDTADNCYWDAAEDTLGVMPGHALVGDPVALRQLKRDAQQAWAEYVPARVTIDPAATHPHDYMSMYRGFRFGRLVEMFVPDARTYRSAPPCGTAPLDIILTPGCEAQLDPGRTMLGAPQRDWLIGGLTQSSALWKAWANAVPAAELLFPNPFAAGAVYAKLDAWDGYLHERGEIEAALQAVDIKNLVLITGDRHASLASYLLADYGAEGGLTDSNILGVEWTAPAVSSPSLNRVFASQLSDYQLDEPSVKDLNPHVRFFDGDANGYGVVTFTRWFCDFRVYRVDQTQNTPETPKVLLRQLRVVTNQKQITDVWP